MMLEVSSVYLKLTNIAEKQQNQNIYLKRIIILEKKKGTTSGALFMLLL